MLRLLVRVALRIGLPNKLFGKSTYQLLAAYPDQFDVAHPNEVHQADLLFLPHDRV